MRLSLRGQRVARSLAILALAAAPVVFVVGSAGVAGATEVGDAGALRDAFENDQTTLIDLTGSITIDDGECDQMVRDSDVDLVIDGHGFSITKDPDCEERVFKQRDIGPITFQNVTVSGGNKFDGSGGGIKSDGPVTVIDSTFTENSVQYGGCDENVSDVDAAGYCGWPVGGAIFSETTVTLTRANITNNHADDSGGGIFSEGNVHVTDSTISGNTAGGPDAYECACFGGGFVAEGGTDVTGSTISNNSATCEMYCGAYGGGFFAGGATSVVNSTVTGNTVGCDWYCGAIGGGFSGGGFGQMGLNVRGLSERADALVLPEPGEVFVDHSTISGNSATCDNLEPTDAQAQEYYYYCGIGGGFYAEGATAVTVNATTLADNQASAYGGAFSTGDGCEECEGLVVRVVNSTVTQNTSGAYGAIDVSGKGETLNLVYDTIDSNVTEGLETWSTGARAASTPNNEEMSANVTATQLNSFGTDITNPIGGVNCQVWWQASSAGYNYSDDGEIDTCGFIQATDNHNADNDPLLGTLGDNGGATQTMLPQFGSPLIDNIAIDDCGDGDELAGTSVTTDQRDVSRPQIRGCDTGAVEVRAATVNVNKVVTGTQGNPVPATGYSFSVSCTDGSGATLTVADATAGGLSDSLTDVMPGSTCTVTEAAVVYTNPAVIIQPTVTYDPSTPPVLAEGQTETVTVTNDYQLVNLLGIVANLQPRFTG